MNLEFIAVGNVDGYVDGQFSLDEKDGYLRVATTSSDAATGESRNNLISWTAE
jgi:uncharacterized secreted protein with C-terminal beta-propeller domain